MRKIYLLVQNDIRTGPFTIKELLHQSLYSTSLIWIIGESEDWLSPLEIPTLQNFFTLKEDGSLLLKQEAQKEWETISLDNNGLLTESPDKTNISDAQLHKAQYSTKTLNDLEDHTDTTFITSSASNQAKYKIQEILNDKYSDFKEEEESYGLGKNKWPVLLTIALLVLLIIWSILFNDNNRLDKPLTYSIPSSQKGSFPTSKTDRIEVPPIKEKEEINNSPGRLPIVIPESGKVVQSMSTVTTDDFLDSVERVLDSQDQMMAAVDAVYKKSFSYPKHNIKLKPSKRSNLPASTLKAGTKTAVNTLSIPVQQQVDLQSRYIKNGSRQNFSGVEVMIKNNSKQLLKTISVDVFYYKKGDHLLDKETVYFNNVYPRQSLTMSLTGNKKATSARSQLGSITLAEKR